MDPYKVQGILQQLAIGMATKSYTDPDNCCTSLKELIHICMKKIYPFFR